MPPPRKRAERFADDKSIAFARRGQLRSASYLLVLIMFWFFCLQLTSIGLFTSGFLLSRIVLDNVSNCTSPIDLQAQVDGCWHPKSFEKAVVVLIDALRWDFLVPPDIGQEQLFCHNAFSLPLELSKTSPSNAVIYKFLADPPTTTIQRLKGMTTGSLPTFVDAGSNFGGAAITEDNLIGQLHSLNKTIAFAEHDDTWMDLFRSLFACLSVRILQCT